MSKDDPYYAGAHRVSRDGIPCRVFIKGPTKGKAEILLASTCGVELRFDDIPGFRFDPELNRHEQLARATQYRAPVQVPKPCPAAKDYYKGGKRLVVGGVPCRVTNVGKDKRHYGYWAKLSDTMRGYSDRKRQFKKDLLDKGRFEAAGERLPYDL